MKPHTMVLLGAVWSVAFATQDRPPPLGRVLGNTAKLKSTAFKVSEGATTFEGESERGTVHYRAGGVEAAGKGGLRIARAGGDWKPVSYLLRTGDGGDALKRLAQLQGRAHDRRDPHRLHGPGERGWALGLRGTSAGGTLRSSYRCRGSM